MGLLFFLSLSMLLALNVSTQDTSLYQGDVDAINIIAHRLRLNWESDERKFSSKGCSSSMVQCDCSLQSRSLCRVTEINFSAQNLKGKIPPEIGNLTCLKSLNLRSNMIHGSIPNSLRNLLNLSFIDLSSNNLGGHIPSFFGEMSSLTVIVLAQNWLRGPIPAALGRLPSLKKLDLGENQLSGPIPMAFGNISSLESMRLSDNNFSGELPPSLGNLTNLYRFVVADNNFRGELPQSLGNLTKLTIFNVRANEFIGAIPKFIGNWKQLETLVLMGNSFEGPIPANAISSLVNLTELYVADLNENHGEEGFSFPEFSGMKSLEYLVLRNCSITGLIPESIGQLPKLIHLDLSFNKLSGVIPNFVYYKNLSNIYLKGNKLTGLLPTWLTDITDANVDFSENNFTDVPVLLSNKLGHTHKFGHVNLFACCSPTLNLTYAWQRNDFRCDHGERKNDRLFINSGGEKIAIKKDTYESDVYAEGASTFYINDKGNWGYSSMGVYDPTQKFMNYTVDTPCGVPITEGVLYGTARVSPVSLKYYGFCMKNGKYRIALHFSEIIMKEEADHRSRGKRLFDVKIQDKKVLTDFNIKDAAGGLHLNASRTFDAVVSDNRLEIHFYWSGKGSKHGIFELYGPLVSAISVYPVPKHRNWWRKLSGLDIAGIAGSAVLLPLLILLVLWKMGCLGGKEPQSKERKDLESLPGGFFSFRQIKAATQNFNSENKIGEGGFGSVYKGVLSNGKTVAVKQLSAKSKQGSREFVNEVGTISALQHPHLVKLLGCCIDESQLLLVYEYMENNSLAHVLFGPEELRLQLKWPTRVKICRGIAKGLAFLHEESKLRIVHRDIKTTNILLDKDFNAKISDFGFAKLYEGEKTHVITRVAGTTGYMAPEYAMRGHLTSKADVYSFGVVMLEIVSGQNSASYRPNDESVYLLDLAYVLQEKGDLVALVDPALGSDYSLKEAKIILELAMLCTNPSPTLRPNMSEVVKILQGKSQLLNLAPIHAPYSADGFAMAKIIASRSFSINSGSNPATPREFSKEGEVLNISVDYSPETTDSTGNSPIMAL